MLTCALRAQVEEIKKEIKNKFYIKSITFATFKIFFFEWLNLLGTQPQKKRGRGEAENNTRQQRLPKQNRKAAGHNTRKNSSQITDNSTKTSNKLNQL
jgi:hypothetical protein